MHRIWVNTVDKVASFKAVDGYELMEYASSESYWAYIHDLTKNGYRFQ